MKLKTFFVCLAALLLLPLNIQAKKYPITWSPKSIEQTIALGNTQDLVATFTSNTALSNVDLWIVPELQPFVSLDQIHFDSIAADTPYTVNLHLDIPSGTQSGLYDGTIHARVGSATYPQTLKLELNVVDAMATIGPSGGVVEVTDPSSPICGASAYFNEETLQDDTLTTINMTEILIPFPEGLESVGPAVDFGPSGVEFTGPVLVSLRVNDSPTSENESIGVAYFNVSENTWELIPPLGYDVENNKVYFIAYNFSTYQPVRSVLEHYTVGTSFDIATDSMTYKNNDFRYCPQFSAGICAAVALYSGWYYKNQGQGLKCDYDFDTGERLCCDLYDEYEDALEWNRWWNFITKRLQSITLGGVKTWLILELSTGNPVSLFMFTDNKNGHAVLVVGYTAVNSTSGYFTIYDVNDNSNFHQIWCYEFPFYTKFEYPEQPAYTKFYIWHKRGLKFDDLFTQYPPADADEDNVGDLCDNCPNTPFDEFANQDGCSFSQLSPQLLSPPNNKSDVDASNVTFTWGPLTHPGGTQVEVEYCISIKEKVDSLTDISFWEGCELGQFLSEPSIQFIDQFEPEKTYVWAVWGKDEYSNWSEPSDWWSFTTISGVQLPLPPTGLSATYDSSNEWNHITWNEVSNADTYHLYWGTEPGVTEASEDGGDTNGETEFTHTEVEPGWTYYYKVRAENAAGESALSQEVSVEVPQEDFPVDFPDPNLEAAIRYFISKPTGDIMYSDLQPLTSLDAHSRNIQNLDGLQHCSNLRWLTLAYNQITDISPLSALSSLTRLLLFRNQIADISPLSGLSNLTKLYLHSNQIADISPLSALINLEVLNLLTNQIAVISPLSSLIDLRELDLAYNQIADISPLSGLSNLTKLDLHFNQIADISPLSTLISLVVLSLGYNQISDISPLVDNAGIGNGDMVVLSYNPLSPTSCNVYIPELESRGVRVSYDCP